MAALPPYDPNFKLAVTVFPKQEIEIDQHDETVSAAIVAVDLISSTRLALKLDSVHTEYSAQYLVDNATGSNGLKLTVKDCLEFVLKNRIPKAEDWPELGSVSKPPSSYKPALVSMKGQVVEPKDSEEATDLVVHQPVGAKLHVFLPHIELQTQQDGIYCGPTGEAASYVGLRDGIIVKVEKIQGKSIATVKLWYKKKFIFLKVAMSRWFIHYSLNREPGTDVGPTYLLVDFCMPRLSIN